MKFRLLTDPAEFRERARPLLADEVRNNLILGILSTVIEDPQAYETCHTMVVEDGDAVIAAALITIPPENLIVAADARNKALQVLAEGVRTVGIRVPRVIGVRPVADHFAALWEHHAGVSGRLTMGQGVYALESVEPPPPVSGRVRRATQGDLDTVFAWICAFSAEALPDETVDEGRLRRRLEERLRRRRHAGIWLWEVEGVPVSTSSHSGPTGSGIRVNAVYTPPKYRGRGYASALVAAQSQALLDSGYSFCCLYTDLANPTSNKIYEAIGYRRVAESAVFEFSAGINPAT